MNRKEQAYVWVFVFGLLTILPILTFIYFGFFVVIISPFAGWLMIRELRNIYRGDYEEFDKKKFYDNFLKRKLSQGEVNAFVDDLY